MAHLGGFVGVLQADGFSGYRAIAAGNSVSLAFGWSHVRRRFYELATAGPAPIASEALRRIAELYKIEDDIRGRTREERCAARQGKSRPITDNLAPWLTEQRAIISRKTKLAAGAEHWATIASLVETAKLNAVEPMARVRAGSEPAGAFRRT